MGIDDELNRLLRLQRELYRSYQFRTPADDFRRFYDLQASVTYQSDVVRHLREIQDGYRKAYEGLAGPRAHLEELHRSEKIYRAALESKFAVNETAAWMRLAYLRPHDDFQTAWSRLANQSLLLWQSSLGALSTQLDVVGQTADSYTRKRITAPTYAFSQFSRATLERLSDARSDQDREALQASLVLAEHQLASGTEMVGDALASVVSRGGSGESGGGGRDRGPGVDTGGEPKEEEPEEPTSGNKGSLQSADGAKLFSLQQQELVATRPDAAPLTQEAVLAGSPTARTAALARRLVNTVGAINRARLLVSREEVFTPTTAGFIATNTLAYVAVTDQQSLGEAVDALYVLIYEGSGEMARVLAWIPDTDCDAVWRLKHLRNYWLRHDPQHGPSKERAKKFAQLSESLLALGATTIPHSVADFQALYERLLGRLCDCMDRLLAAIAADPQKQ